MADISASMIKQLREKSGAGMMDCKKALKETDGDFEKAMDWLREKGFASAAKKSSRVASEGLVAAITGGTSGVALEVNAETDFVSRNETFQAFVKTLAELIHSEQPASLEALQELSYPGTDRTVSEELTNLIASIGENMTIRRFESQNVGQGSVVSYIHNALTPETGKIAVLVALESSASADVLQALGKKIAMHIAAAQPLSLTTDELDASVVERERSILAEQARASGKPEEIIEKMLIGRMRKFFEEVVLLEQIFVMDNESKIKDVITQAGKEAGAEITLKAFTRFALGEGIEKEESNFADEVKQQLAS